MHQYSVHQTKEASEASVTYLKNSRNESLHNTSRMGSQIAQHKNPIIHHKQLQESPSIDTKCKSDISLTNMSRLAASMPVPRRLPNLSTTNKVENKNSGTPTPVLIYTQWSPEAGSSKLTHYSNRALLYTRKVHTPRSSPQSLLSLTLSLSPD